MRRYLATNPLHCLSYQSQPSSGAGVVLVSVQAVEYLENLVVKLHIKSDPLIANLNLASKVSRQAADTDPRRLVIFCKFDSIIDEVAQSLLEPFLLGFNIYTADVNLKVNCPF